jgi:hypothetical protein
LLVRPEGFEPPTLWFEAKCSIQLSYGRLGNKGILQLTCWLRGWGGRGRGEHGQGFDDVEAGSAEELVDDGLGEAGGVVLDADSAGGFVEFELADAVDLAEAGDG